MRILIINTKEAGGGAAEIAGYLGERYAAAGHDVRWLVGLRSRHRDDRVIECPAPLNGGIWQRLGPALLQRFGLARHGAAEARMRWRRLGQTLVGRSRLARWRGHEDFSLFRDGWKSFAQLLPWEPDVVHLHNLHGFNHLTHFDLRLLPEMTRRWPTVITFHDPWLLTGHCAHFIDCGRWRHGCGECPRLGIYPAVSRDATARNWAAKAGLWRSSRMHGIAVCDWMATQVRESMLAPAMASLRTIPNGIDVRRFVPAAAAERRARRRTLGLSEEAWVVTYASELGEKNPFRDFQAMRRAVRELASQLAPRPVVAVELGAADAGRLQEGNLALHSPGFVSRERMAEWLSVADVVLHAAVADTSPTIVYEAMGCGVPVVATAVCGVPEQLEHGVTGILVRPGDPAALAAALVNVARHPERAAAMGRAARAWMEAARTREGMAERYLTTLSEVTGA